MTDINPETGEAVSQGRSQRFTLWVAFLVFSTITMGASVQVKNNAKGSPSAESKWAVACSTVTFAMTAVIVVAHLFPVSSTVVVGSKLEGILILVLTAFWAATVSIVTNANNGLAVKESNTNQVTNGNLYYFSWAGFVTAVILFVNYLRHAFGVDVAGELRNRAARLTLWAGLLASALVVMGSSARVLNEDCGSNSTTNLADPTIYCKRTKFAVALGSISVVCSGIIVGTKLVTSAFMVEFFASILLAAMNAFGVAYVTSPKGPGSAIGNLYYFSWIQFLCSAMLAAECFNQYSGGAVTDAVNNFKPQGNGSPTSRTSGGGGDIEVETFDDQI